MKPIPSDDHYLSSLNLYYLMTFIYFFIFVVAPNMLPANADTKNTYIGISGGYGTGDFGGPTRTTISYIATEVGYVRPSYNVSLAAPYLFMSSNDDSEQNSGMGDIVIKVGGGLINNEENGFSVDGSLSVKLPTASTKNGFGTGETDYGGFLDIGKEIGDIRIALLPGYIYTGDSSTQKYKDIKIYSIGASTVYERTYYYLSYEYRTSMFSQEEDPQYLNGGFFHALNETHAINGEASFGLSKGSPDLGLQLGWVTWF